MIINFSEKKRKIFRKIFGFLSFSTALFVFQACYGTPQDIGKDVYINGIVKSKSTNLPIKGIKVTIDNLVNRLTDSSGFFEFYTTPSDKYEFRFEDIDSTNNGEYHYKDTVIISKENSMLLNIYLNEQ